jgi:hypothetical protein
VTLRHYRATHKITGEVAEYDADLPQAEHLGPDWRVEVVEEVAPSSDDPPPPYEGTWRITKLAFRNRFTQSEKVAIEIAALDDPAAPMQQRAMSAALRASQMDVQAAQFIDLTRADTRAGVQQLEAVGILAAGRAAVILDTPPSEQEVWNG